MIISFSLETTILLTVVFLIAILCYQIFFHAIKRGSKHALVSHAIGLKSHIGPSLVGALFFLLGYLLFPLIDPQDTVGPIRDIFWILWVICGASAASQGIHFLYTLLAQRYRFNEAATSFKARRLYTKYLLLRRIADVMIIFVAIGLIVITFEPVRQLGVSILASAGIAGLIIGFAAQKMLANVLAGLQLAFAQPIRIDDVVIVEGEWGWVEEIHLTFVVVRVWDKRRIVLPTSYFLEQPFQHWTRNTTSLLGAVHLWCDYTVPVDVLRGEFHRLLTSDDRWDEEVKEVEVTDASEKGVQVRFLMSARNADDMWHLRCAMRERLVTYLQKHHPAVLPVSRVLVKEK